MESEGFIMFRKYLACLVALLLAFGGFAAFAEEAASTNSDVIVLYTNDVHCAIDTNIGYAGLAAYRKAF